MNRQMIEEAMAFVPHSCLEWTPVVDGRTGQWQLVVHTMATEDRDGHGPEVRIGPFDGRGEPAERDMTEGELRVETSEGFGFTARSVEAVTAAVLSAMIAWSVTVETPIAVQLGQGVPLDVLASVMRGAADEAETQGARGRRLRQAIIDAADAAFHGGALSADWYASIAANVSEPDKDDEVAGAILDHELASERGQALVSDRDLGHLMGMVAKYGRDPVVRAAQTVEPI